MAFSTRALGVPVTPAPLQDYSHVFINRFIIIPLLSALLPATSPLSFLSLLTSCCISHPSSLSSVLLQSAVNTFVISLLPN